MNIYRIQHPFIFTIFGASGELARLKLFPALYSLAEQKRLPPSYRIFGFARTALSERQFRRLFKSSITSAYKNPDRKILDDLLAHVHYFTGDYDEASSFKKFRQLIGKITGKKNCTHIAYFSVPPQAFRPIVKNLAETRPEQTEDLRLVLEKPFGSGSESAEKLFHFISGYFDKKDVYLLDHYLGKSGIQSILNLRHSNRLLNTLLKGEEISNIQISALEKVGVTNRIGYFEKTGIVRDMIQSHLLQILALITMSIPVSDRPEALQREKFNILSAIRIPEASKDNFVLGRYESYLKEPGVDKKSSIETFAAVKLHIDQEAWYGVPIYIRTGKKLTSKQTYIAVEFKKFSFQNKSDAPNLLFISVSPEEKISIQLVNKYRSGESHYETVTTSESLACSGEYCLPEHALLLLDVIRKNRIHFLSFDEILASWRVTEKLCATVRKAKIKPENYRDYSSGPENQHKITAKNGHKWHNPANLKNNHER